MKQTLIYLAVSSALALTACGSSSNSDSKSEIDDIQEVEQKEIKNQDPTKNSQNNIGLFELDNILDINIEMSNSDWQAMSYEGPTPAQSLSSKTLFSPKCVTKYIRWPSDFYTRLVPARGVFTKYFLHPKFFSHDFLQPKVFL